MKKIASKILAGILAVTLAMPTMSFDVTAAKASDGQMTDAAKSLSETQSIVYNTATLYNYSDTFYKGGKQTINMIDGKGDYNKATQDIAYAEYPDAAKWEGLYFSAGTEDEMGYSTNLATNFTISDMNSNQGEIKNGSDGLWNGDTKTKAWTTWTESPNTSGYISLHAHSAQTVKKIQLYFLNNETSSGSVFPTTVNVYNGAYSSNTKKLIKSVSGNTSTETNTILDIDLESEVTTTDLTFEFMYDSGKYIMLTEINLYSDPGTEIKHISKSPADYNIWSGNSKVGGNDKRAYIYSGLAKSTLTNGQIQFNVPQAGLFDASDTSNKEVYTNVGVPYIYDSATGYYTFDAGSNGYGVHFNDSNEDNIIDAEEKQSGVNLVLDTAFAATDTVNNNYDNPGFYPFNCAGGTASDAVYHFGMSTVIDFTMTADGTVDGNGGKPITFEFAGDDDVWVFIDGQLVLDLGGIHDSVSGKIDFKENKITMWSTNTKLGSGDIRTGNGSTTADYVTDLGQILNSDTGTGAIAKSYDKFAAEGEHKLAIYYLERGRGESNCKIQYNLPRQDALEVTKSIKLDPNETEKITDEEWSALNALSFKMRVLDSSKNPVTGKYALYNSSEYVGTYQTDSDGYFTLKNNQKARFTGTLGTGYTVQEVSTEDNLPSAIWKAAQWSGTLTAAKVTNLPSTSTNNDNSDNTNVLEYKLNDLAVRDDEVDTLAINCTNYISRPFVSVAGETVVIDYGLPVKIDIMANDVQSLGKKFIISNISAPSYGTVKVIDKNGQEVSKDTYTTTAGYYYLEYALNTYMSNVEKITYTYKVLDDKLSGTETYSYPTGVATIIPATSMYYEENFLNSEGNNYIKFSTVSGYTGFTAEGSADKVYQEPGVVGTLNDSTYGTDTVYLDDNRDSNGTSFKADTANGPAAFQYTFTGTGTAIFARTSDKSGYLRISVKDADGNSMITNADGESANYQYIDTKYKESTETDTYDVTLPLYNIPVFNMKDLPYGTYTVTVTVAKPSQWYTGQNEFYLDGIRVYNPIDMDQEDCDTEVYAAYKKDLEADAKVNTLRNYMLDTQTVDPDAEEPVWTDNSQVMFTDTNGKIVTASEYQSNGPKQELYMTSGQSIRFILSNWYSDKPTDAKLYIGAKVPEGKKGIFKVNGTAYTISNTVDCYYDITSAIKTIENSHHGLCIIEVESSLISFTNLKCTGFVMFDLNEMPIDGDESGNSTYSLLRRTIAVEELPSEETSQEVTEPEESVEETTQEVAEPEESIEETTQEETEPEESVEETSQEETESEESSEESESGSTETGGSSENGQQSNILTIIWNILQKLFH